MTKKSRQKIKYLENKKSFLGEKKAFFIIFKGLLVAKNCLRPEGAPLSHTSSKLHISQSHISLKTTNCYLKSGNIYIYIATSNV